MVLKRYDGTKIFPAKLWLEFPWQELRGRHCPFCLFSLFGAPNWGKLNTQALGHTSPTYSDTWPHPHKGASVWGFDLLCGSWEWVNRGRWPRGRMGFVKNSVEWQNPCPRHHRTARLILASWGRGAPHRPLTSIVLQKHNSGIDNCRGGVGRRWLANWRKGLGISSSVGWRNFI